MSTTANISVANVLADFECIYSGTVRSLLRKPTICRVFMSAFLRRHD